MSCNDVQLCVSDIDVLTMICYKSILEETNLYKMLSHLKNDNKIG